MTVPGLTVEDGTRLLELARGSLSARLLKDGSLERLIEATEISPALAASRGAFVSLKEGSRLRGCIGNVTSSLTLYRNVIEVAPKAAFEDPRFTPLTSAELPRVRIEVSALTPPRPLDDIDELVPGRDGVQLDTESRRAVFLPQVAAEQRWDRSQLLRHLALKAGLDPDEWRRARLSVFRAEVFRE